MDDKVIINLAMLRLSDKLLELEEHLKYEQELVMELNKLIKDWADVLTATPVYE